MKKDKIGDIWFSRNHPKLGRFALTIVVHVGKGNDESRMAILYSSSDFFRKPKERYLHQHDEEVQQKFIRDVISARVSNQLIFLPSYKTFYEGMYRTTKNFSISNVRCRFSQLRLNTEWTPIKTAGQLREILFLLYEERREDPKLLHPYHSCLFDIFTRKPDLKSMLTPKTSL